MTWPSLLRCFFFVGILSRASLAATVARFAIGHWLSTCTRENLRFFSSQVKIFILHQLNNTGDIMGVNGTSCNWT